jgi:maleylpyruvate isomerase
MTADPLVLVPEVDRATDRLLATVSSLTGDDVAVPSLLPGWTRGHVLTHLARHADGGVNLLTWARTGVPTPQYESVARRPGGSPRRWPRCPHRPGPRSCNGPAARAVPPPR